MSTDAIVTAFDIAEGFAVNLIDGEMSSDSVKRFV